MLERAALPGSVPQEYEFDKRVCEDHQAVLADTGHFKPVIEDVQVHLSAAAPRPQGQTCSILPDICTAASPPHARIGNAC